MGGFPARLHVILAREAPVGIVIRRGPSDQVCTLAWDREADTFELGQWLKGRIYERRCDVSTDGAFFIYFAANQKPPHYAWTAVSRTPWLTAIHFWGWGHTWNGGGLFTGASTYRLNGRYGEQELVSREVECVGDLQVGPGECPPIYYHRLKRDGWVDRGDRPRRSGLVDSGVVVARIFEKALPGDWILRKLAYASASRLREGLGCYWDEHQLEHPRGLLLDRREWEWADWDRQRLVWATGGRLYAAELTDDGPDDVRCLHDFNELVFEQRCAPYDRRPESRS